MNSSVIFELSGINRKIQSIFDIESLLNYITSQVPGMLECEYSYIGLYDKITGEIYYYSGSKKYKKQNQIFIRSKKGTGIIGWVAENLKSVRTDDALSDNRFVKSIDAQGRDNVQSFLAVPMISRDNLIGVFAAINQIRQKAFSGYHESLLNILGGLAAAHIDLIRLSEAHTSQIRLSDLGQSIASSAHGLKNILNNMDGGTYIVERGVASKNMESVNKGWDILKRNSQRMREIVLDMLLFSRPRKPEFRPSDINKICWDIYELVRENACRKRISFQLDFDDRIKFVCIDPKGIYRCILNLVSNAIDACSRTGGIITMTTHSMENEDLQIRIGDNGPGISKHNINHIFDVFYTTKGSLGTGLGLPVTQKIIAEHKGHIDVKSKLGSGTTFIITIPKSFECEDEK